MLWFTSIAGTRSVGMDFFEITGIRSFPEVDLFVCVLIMLLLIGMELISGPQING